MAEAGGGEEAAEEDPMAVDGEEIGEGVGVSRLPVKYSGTGEGVEDEDGEVSAFEGGRGRASSTVEFLASLSASTRSRFSTFIINIPSS